MTDGIPDAARWPTTHGRVRYAAARTKPSGSRRLRPPRGSPATRGGTAGAGPARGGWPLPACGEPMRIKPHQTGCGKVTALPSFYVTGNISVDLPITERSAPDHGLVVCRSLNFQGLWVRIPEGGKKRALFYVHCCWAAEPHVCPPVCIHDARDAQSRTCIEIQNNMDARYRFGIKYTMQLDAAEPGCI